MFRNPIEVNILARGDLADRRVAAHRRPDLDLELAFSNIIAEELVVCIPSVITLQHSQDIYLQQ